MKTLNNVHFISTLAISIFFPIIIYCHHFTNPFDNIDNADVHFFPEPTFNTRVTDTLNIFSNDTLYLSATVPELIDSFSVKISNNRDFPETTIVAPTAQAYAFRVSIYTTGNQVITIDIFRKGRSPVSRNILFYAKNPLHQLDLISKNMEDSITLQTAPVEDNSQVVYTWILEHIVARSPFSLVKIKPYLMDNNEHTGQLYISDSIHTSPVTTFKFSFRDTIPPVILCLNADYDSTTHTIRTPDTFIVFQVKVFDGENQKAAIVRFNGEEPGSVSNLIYSRVIHNIKPYSGTHPLMIAVQASDKVFAGNFTSDTFKIVHDPSTVKKNTTLITISMILTDSLTTSASPIIINGTIANTNNNALILKCYLNTNPVSTTPFPYGNGIWSCICNIASTLNEFVAEAYDTSNNLLARKTLSIFYDSRAVDSTPPVILSMEINGVQSKKVYTHEDTARITLFAFDYGSGIQKVTIDSSNLQVDNNQYRWSWMIKNVKHTWKRIAISITDAKDNHISDTLQIMYNRYPSATLLKLPFAIKTDTTYKGQLFPLDLDEDTLAIHLLQKPDDMVFSENYRQFTWTPNKNNSGYDTLSFFVFDGYEYSEKYVYNFNIYDPLSTNASIHISDQQDIPPFLIAGQDTLRLKIKLGEPSGVPPYRFQTRILKSTGSLDFFSNDGITHWAPSKADTGTCQLRMYVADKLERADTFITQFPVIPPNTDSADLILTSITNASIIDSTAMMLNLNDSTCLLDFMIRDTDHPFTEKYHATTTINNSMTSFTPSDKQFQVKVNGSLFNNDTVLITLKDSTRQNPDTLRFIIVNIIENPNKINGLARWYLPQNFVSAFLTTIWKDYTNSTNDLNGYGDIYFRQNSLNGLPTIELSSAYFSNTQGGNWMANQFSIYIVASYDELPSNTNQALVSNFGLSFPNSNAYALGLSSSGEVIVFTTAGLSPTTTVKTALYTKKQNWYVYSFSSNGRISASQSITINAGLNQNFSEITTSDYPDRSNIAIGTNSAPGNKWAGNIAEIIQYDRNLSTLESKKVIGYLMVKYGLK